MVLDSLYFQIVAGSVPLVMISIARPCSKQSGQLERACSTPVRNGSTASYESRKAREPTSKIFVMPYC